MIETYLDFDSTWSTFASEGHWVTVHGVRAWKLQDDLDRYERVIEQTKPDLIVEVGTKWGGSALWLSEFGIDVVTVDIQHEIIGLAQQVDGERWRPRLTFIEGDSVADETIEAVRRAIRGHERVMVSLDGEHAAPHVLREIELYAPLVTVGCYLVVEDGIFDLAPKDRAHLGGARIPAEGGPLLAIEQSGLLDSPYWERDLAIEQITERTYHPAGFLKRIEGS